MRKYERINENREKQTYYKYMNTEIIFKENRYELVLHYEKTKMYTSSLKRAKILIDRDFCHWIKACLLNDAKTGIHKTTHQITKEYKQGICELED